MDDLKALCFMIVTTCVGVYIFASSVVLGNSYMLKQQRWLCTKTAIIDGNGECVQYSMKETK